MHYVARCGQTHKLCSVDQGEPKSARYMYTRKSFSFPLSSLFVCFFLCFLLLLTSSHPSPPFLYPFPPPPHPTGLLLWWLRRPECIGHQSSHSKAPLPGLHLPHPHHHWIPVCCGGNSAGEMEIRLQPYSNYYCLLHTLCLINSLLLPYQKLGRPCT